MSVTRSSIPAARSGEWRRRAVCTADDVALTTSQPGRSPLAAAVVCHSCPVAIACLAEAMADEAGSSRDSRATIRGGLSAHARYALEKRAQPTPAALAAAVAQTRARWAARRTAMLSAPGGVASAPPAGVGARGGQRGW